ERLEEREVVDARRRRADLPDAREVLDRLARPPRRRRLDDVVTELLEELGRRVRGSRALRVDRHVDRRLGRHRDAQTSRLAVALLEERAVWVGRDEEV